MSLYCGSGSKTSIGSSPLLLYTSSLPTLLPPTPIPTLTLISTFSPPTYQISQYNTVK